MEPASLRQHRAERNSGCSFQSDHTLRAATGIVDVRDDGIDFIPLKAPRPANVGNPEHRD